MPVNPTYPGIYLEEIPSSSRTITAAPTSITVFVGYTHPFKTKKFDEAVEIFDFTEYQREFGGFYVSGVFQQNVAYAVNQFFQNGGSSAYVVGLKPEYQGATPANPEDVAPDPLSIQGIVFTPLEPTDQIPISVTINNPRKTFSVPPIPPPSTPSALLPFSPPDPDSFDTADITITYNKQVETFRGVKIYSSTTDPSEDPEFIDNRINGVSALVMVKPETGVRYTSYIKAEKTPIPVTNFPLGVTTTFDPVDFTKVFQEDSSLDKVSIFNLLVIPGVGADSNSIWSVALAFCERKQAFAILDPPAEAAADRSSALPWIADKFEIVPKSKNGAIYFPYLKSTDILTGDRRDLPPSGYVAGIYARTDLNRGVWKAPAGLETTILNTTGVVERGKMTDQRQGTLNPIGVNCLRSFPGIGTVVYGARTLVGSDINTAFQQSKYVPVRRMTLFIKQTLYRNLGWVVFEPNDEPLWVAIRTSIEAFMLSLFNQGAFQGSTPSQAFQVKCDKSTTTQQDINNGVVNIIVAFAPLKPAEFVIVKIAQLAGQVQS
jgi:uncharacterized protein